MRVGWYWLGISCLCLVNVYSNHNHDTPRTLFLLSSWACIGLWSEARARTKERDAAAKGGAE